MCRDEVMNVRKDSGEIGACLQKQTPGPCLDLLVHIYREDRHLRENFRFLPCQGEFLVKMRSLAESSAEGLQP